MKILFDTNKSRYPLTEGEIKTLNDLGVKYVQGECFKEEDLIKGARNAEIIKNVGWVPFKRETFKKLPKLKFLIHQALGYDNIDVGSAKELDISVSNVPGFNIEEVATHAVVLLLSSIRKIKFYDNYIRSGKWGKDIPEESVDTLQNEIIGIIGFGNIGKSLMEKLKGYGANFYIHDPYIKINETDDIRKSELEELLVKSRYIFLTCNLNNENFHLINERRLKLLRKDAVIINVARGKLIEEKELIKCLLAKKISGVALDTFEEEPISKDNPLIKMDNIIITPHIAGTSVKALNLMHKMVFEEIVRVVKGHKPEYRVNN